MSATATKNSTENKKRRVEDFPDLPDGLGIIATRNIQVFKFEDLKANGEDHLADRLKDPKFKAIYDKVWNAKTVPTCTEDFTPATHPFGSDEVLEEYLASAGIFPVYVRDEVAVKWLEEKYKLDCKKPHVFELLYWHFHHYCGSYRLATKDAVDPGIVLVPTSLIPIFKVKALPDTAIEAVLMADRIITSHAWDSKMVDQMAPDVATWKLRALQELKTVVKALSEDDRKTLPAEYQLAALDQDIDEMSKEVERLRLVGDFESEEGAGAGAAPVDDDDVGVDRVQT